MSDVARGRKAPSSSPGRAPKPKVLLGELLVAKGLVSASQLTEALRAQAQHGDYFGAILVRLGFLTEAQLLEALAEQVGIPFLRLADHPIDPRAIARVPATVASRYRLMPLALDGGALQVAIADPFDIQALDELQLLLGCAIHPLLASPQDIQEAIQRHYGVGASAVKQLLDTGGYHAEAARQQTEDLSSLADEASVVAFVNQLILQAVQDRATDIHIEPYEASMRIRERVDGVLYEMPIPRDLVKLHQAVISRIKVMAKLDIAERRLPQDGRIKVRLPAPSGARQAGLTDDELDLRVSVLPTSFGEAVDIRVLTPGMLYSLSQLGLGDDSLRLLEELIAKPHGIIFVTGPTGSGKTTTLYACLSQLNSADRKIVTIEDPIEYQLSGITQIQVHPKIGLSFAQGLRSILRHDPDIMMVGEVRDPETAEITIRSALTGHLVFSTLHTNDAAGGITRLLDMGIEPFLVASSVLCFIAQRLVRVVCGECREPAAAGAKLCEQFGVTELPPQLFRGRGCPACKGTGFKGRTAIYEFLLVTEPVHQLILRRASAQEILQAAQRGGMRTLRQDGWLKIARGITTPEEVLRVS